MGRAGRGLRVQLAGSAPATAVRGDNAPLEADSPHGPADDAPAGQVPAGDVPAGDVPAGGRPRGLGRAAPLARHLILLACYVAAGIAVTWPRVTYLAGRLPDTRDAGGYVWDFWWVARQVSHLGNPWSTSYIAAPVGTALGYHTLMPLPGLLMTPITLAFGPSASYNLLSIACPGLLCYVMYRAARLWIPSQTGAIATGALFGLSSILAWRSWYEINLAAGALFCPWPWKRPCGCAAGPAAARPSPWAWSWAPRSSPTRNQPSWRPS